MRWAYRKSAIFTTVHSGARRTSEPETNLSLSWSKFVARSVLFHTYQYGETRVRTKFRIVSKTEIKSRPGKRANQDSPWKTKRANSCWSQTWDPEARTSRRVWQKEVSRNWLESLILSEGKLIILLQVMTNPGEINYYFKKNYQNKIGFFVKLLSGICERWQNCWKITC